jgi:hypothetical protein
MQLMPQGDHYVWHCEWCDTKNKTLWTNIEKNQLSCAACQKKFSAFEESHSQKSPVNNSYYQLLS